MSIDNPSEGTFFGENAEELNEISEEGLPNQKVLSRRRSKTSVEDIRSISRNSSKDRGRSFSDAVQDIERDDITREIQNFRYDAKSKKSVIKFAKTLRNASSSQDAGPRTKKTEDTITTLSSLYNEKYEALKRRVKDLKETRLPFIKKLEEFINKLDKRSKWCSGIRLLASTVDIAGSVGGLLLNDESNWARYAFNSASFCGLCGAISTVMEVASSKNILDKVSDMREEDYSLFVSVVEWFQENSELDRVVQDLFPYGNDNEVACQIQEASRELDGYLKIFQSVILSNVRRDNQLLGDKDFLRSLQIFSQSDVAVLWWNRIIFRKHPFQLDMNRITLQMEFGQMQSLVFQSIPALPLEQQRLTSLPVAGRIMLNILTMYDAFTDLNSGAKSLHSDKLRKLLKAMKRELEIIDDALEGMRLVE